MKKVDLIWQKRGLLQPTTKTHNPDLLVFGLGVILTLFGLLMVYDASQVEAFQEFADKFYYIKQQSLSAAIGFCCLIFFSLFDYHRLAKLSTAFFLGSLLLLLMVFIPGLGVVAGGAHRWLRIFGFTIQPSEIIKLSIIIFLSAFFQKQVKTSWFILILSLVTVIIGLLQKDLGSMVVFSVIAFGIYFMAGANPVYFLGLLLMGFVGVIGFIFTSSYRRHRVLAFLDPFTDPQGFSYHISQVLIALGSGGLLGLGIGQSRQKFAYIPEVTTDSIFSIIGEEFGFIGGVVLIFLFGLLIWRCFGIVQKAPEKFGKLLASGLTIWLGSQAIVNLSAMVSLIPLTGVPLPFISYGGTALIANLTAVGILLNISRQTSI